MKRKLAVIGVGNMAKAIIAGISSSDIPVSSIVLFDINIEQYASVKADVLYAGSVKEAVESADCILLSVKPQNYPEILSQIKTADGYRNKLYISIGAGIPVKTVSDSLECLQVVRVLPNVPMLIGKGVSVICRSDTVSSCDFEFVKAVFASAGSVLEIDESEMNRIIGVTSSSPAYVFRFIKAIYDGAVEQGLSSDGLLDAVCDMVIGSATMLRNSQDTPEELISKVASKGGTTERALLKLDSKDFDNTIKEAMLACTERADELGGKNK